MLYVGDYFVAVLGAYVQYGVDRISGTSIGTNRCGQYRSQLVYLKYVPGSWAALINPYLLLLRPLTLTKHHYGITNAQDEDQLSV